MCFDSQQWLSEQSWSRNIYIYIYNKRHLWSHLIVMLASMPLQSKQVLMLYPPGKFSELMLAFIFASLFLSLSTSVLRLNYVSSNLQCYSVAIHTYIIARTLECSLPCPALNHISQSTGYASQVNLWCIMMGFSTY